MNKARVAGIFYLLNIVTGAAALFVRGTIGVAIMLVAAACYVAVTILFYGLFKPVNRNISMLASLVSLAGCVLSILSALRLAPARPSPLLFFGFYCLLVGYLVFRSTFLPRALGVLMAIGGIGWLTFGISNLLSLRLGNNLPAFVLPGLVGEGALTVWLLIFGVDMPKWESMQTTADARLHA